MTSDSNNFPYDEFNLVCLQYNLLCMEKKFKEKVQMGWPSSGISGTAPHHTAPGRRAPHRTNCHSLRTTHRTAPKSAQRTAAPHRTAPKKCSILV
ncbi:hypothetical protein Avbf_15695 [Armadillidium vulgare]|nr:hypothetical protein Avbf_15695 [Armadillidium vulgare]